MQESVKSSLGFLCQWAKLRNRMLRLANDCYHELCEGFHWSTTACPIVSSRLSTVVRLIDMFQQAVVSEKQFLIGASF